MNCDYPYERYLTPNFWGFLGFGSFFAGGQLSENERSLNATTPKESDPQ